MNATERVAMRFADSDETILAPDGCDIEQAVRWLARRYHPTADIRIKRLSPTCFECTNNRRGPNKRACIIHLVD